MKRKIELKRWAHPSTVLDSRNETYSKLVYGLDVKFLLAVTVLAVHHRLMGAHDNWQPVSHQLVSLFGRFWSDRFWHYSHWWVLKILWYLIHDQVMPLKWNLSRKGQVWLRWELQMFNTSIMIRIKFHNGQQHKNSESFDWDSVLVGIKLPRNEMNYHLQIWCKPQYQQPRLQ